MNQINLFTDKEGLDLHKEGFSFYAWTEDIKEEDDLEIEVESDFVRSAKLSEGGSNFFVYSEAKVKVIENDG